MIVSASRDTLFDAVHCARKAVPGRDTLPILKNLSLTANATGLHLVGTDLEMAVKVTLRTCETRKDGAICIPAEPFAKLLGELPTGTVTLEAKDYHLHITVDGGSFRSKIAGVDISEYPLIPDVDGIAATTDKATILRLIASVGFAVSRDTTRLALNGICITRNRRHALAVATDGHRLARLTASAWRFVDDVDGPGEWIIPVAALKALSGMCSDQVAVRIGDNAISMASEPSDGMQAEVIAQLIAGPYPNWRQVIRASSPHLVVFQREELQGALRRAIAVSKGPSPRIILRVSGSQAGVVISSFGPEGLEREGSEIVSARIKTNDAPPEWSCNPAFLEEIVGLCPTPEIRIELGDTPLRPVHIVPCVDPCDQFFLAMPLRLDAQESQA